MGATVFQKINFTVLVVGTIYNWSKIEKILKLSNSYKLIIINGSICHPEMKIEENFEYLESLFKNNIKYNLSGTDLIWSSNNHDNKISEWLKAQPNIIFLEFKNQTNAIITSGGITPQMNKEMLKNNIETTFVSNICDMPWHNKYYGKYGYIISNNPLTLEEPKFYPYSLQMGNKEGGNTYAAEIGPTGVKNIIII